MSNLTRKIMTMMNNTKRAAGCFAGTLCKAFREFGYEVQRLQVSYAKRNGVGCK